ncbi:hypothetical protein [Streptomyces sp. EN23]|uniref:hypothetical protein n=1 Tax=Streptomyces sp. EN23 TaxID=212774 RepID=UPI000851C6D4|nr:hypothetical protein [Streptomyces sp. EN23]
MIDEALVRELLDAADDDSALVLVEGRARVAGQDALSGGDLRGGAVVLTRAELVDRLGTSSPAPQDLTLMAAALDDAVGKLGG